MALIAFPTGYDIVSEGWDIDVPAQWNRSGWTGRSKGVALPGASQWHCTVAFEPIPTEAQERALRAFTIASRGVVNHFRVPVACSQTIAANPQVRAGAGGGFTLPLEGLTPMSVALLAGQFLTVPLPSGHHRLVCLTADLATNGQGQATAVFGPDLGETPVAGVSVEIRDPYCPMRRTQPRAGWTRSEGVAVFQFDAEEAL